MRRVAVLVALVVAVAACGIPLQSEPEALDIEISPVSLPPAAEAWAVQSFFSQPRRPVEGHRLDIPAGQLPVSNASGVSLPGW